jgi:hypothetical protein
LAAFLRQPDGVSVTAFGRRVTPYGRAARQRVAPDAWSRRMRAITEATKKEVEVDRLRK